MTLEDFFTLHELKNGLTNPDRVKELINMMQSDKDFLVNVSQTTWNWSTVATTIAATENKNCLDLFINLNGPSIINKWLKEAQKLQNDNENGDIKELIISLLSALERLQVDKEKNENDTQTGPQTDKITESVTTNQKVPDCKSKVDVENNILVKSEVLSTKTETVEKSDVKDKVDLTEMGIQEQIVSSADVDNALQPSSRNADVLSEKDEEMLDDGESQKMASNSEDAETLVLQISDVAQETELETGPRFLEFDLNKDVSSDEVDNPVNPVTSTISVVSASRAAACTGSPTAPFLDFDLNVADDSEDKTAIVSGGPSGEESCVAHPRIPGWPQLDLNSIEDDRNRWRSPSRSSSSSSKLPLKRKIDLNLNDTSLDHSVISIFGKKVRVLKKDPFMVPGMDFNLGKPLESSIPNSDPDSNPNNSIPPFYGHHNGMFFSMQMYGSSPIPIQMPYMVDSRGAAFVPQVMPAQQPLPFVVNMTSTGGPHLQQNVDLNTDLMINGGNKETNGLQVFFPQTPSNLTFGGKRHEPESGFDFFPVNKHHQPSWR